MEQRGPRRIPLPWLLAVFVASMVLGFIGDIAGPKLINDHPLLQIALNPRNRWLLLATPQLSALSFYTVGFLRLVSTDPIGYVLGYQYGDKAVAWAEKQMGDTTGVIRMIQRGFGKVAPLVILIMPSFYWCVLAGAARMRLRVFVTLNIVGTIGRLVLFRIAGEAFREELEDILEFVQRYQWWLVGLSLIIVTITIFRSGGIETPDEILEEMETEESLSDE